MASPDLLTVLRSPAVIATAIGLAGLGFFHGYYLGNRGSLTSASGSKTAKKSWPNSYDVTVHRGSSDEEDESDEDEEDDEDGEDLGDGGDGKELQDFSRNNEEVKLVLVVRTDLGMQKGKIAAQASHATLACYKYLSNFPKARPLLRRWEAHGQPKIALQGKSEEDLITMQAQAMNLGLCAKTIRDAGRTQIAAGSLTVLGILGPKSVVDGVTGHLKLL